MGHLITRPTKKKMTKKDHLLEIQAQLKVAGEDLELKTLSAVYDIFVDTIGYALGDGHSVVVRGLGRFESRYRQPKSFRSANTGEPVPLKERYVPFLVISRKLKKYTWDRPITEPKPAYNRAQATRDRVRRNRLQRADYDPNSDLFEEDDDY